MKGRARRTSLKELARMMAHLRGPQGCPWDREQTHASLLKYLKEETLEVCEAVKKEDWHNLKEELGDLVLHILFHSQLAAEKGHFTLDDVIETLRKKLVRRHPHVFGPGRKKVLTADEVRRRWKLIKAEEKRGRTSIVR